MTSTSAKIATVISADLVEASATPGEIRVNSETADYIREPPPPYTLCNGAELNSLPIIHHTVIIQQPLKYQPTIHTCGACGDTITTKVEYVNTRKTHMCAGFICGCTLWCMLCCLGAIPYLLPICKKAKHYCPSCNHFIGDYSKV